MRIARSAITPLANMSLRGLGLVARFALTAYMARYLSLADVGVFGLVAGIAGMAPSLLGWGANFFLGREIVGLTPAAAAPLIRDRLILRILTVMAALAALSLLWPLLPSAQKDLAFILIPLVFLETVAADIHISLICLSRPLTANLLLFIRSSAWAYFVIAAGLIDEEMRDLTVIFKTWMGFLFSYYVFLFLLTREWGLKKTLSTPVDWERIKNRVKEGKLIYVNEIGLILTLYIDRYVVEYFTNLTQTGIFVLYWSISNGIHVLVTTGLIEPALPSLVSAHREGGEMAWAAAFRKKALHVAGAALAISGLVFACAYFGFQRFNLGEIDNYWSLLLLLIIGTCTRLISDVINLGMYSRRFDTQLSLINISSIFISIIFSSIALHFVGLIGAGIAGICTPLAVMGLRFITLTKARQRFAAS